MSLKELKSRLKKVLRTKPRKFQIQGIRFIERNKGKVILGDDTGVGKTIQVLGYLALHPELRPVIITCPANAKYVWESQMKEHTRKLKCEVLSGQKPYKIEEDIIVINYDIIPHWKNFLYDFNSKVLIIDECHYLKNRGIKRTEICKNISRKCDIIIPISGTPLINKPIEFFPVLNMLFPKEFTSYWKFGFRYSYAKKRWRGRGGDFIGAKNTKELNEKIKPFIIRRLKEEVLPELPKKQIIIISVDISNRNEYDKAQNDFKKWYEKKYGEERYKKIKKLGEEIGGVMVGQLKYLSEIGKIKPAIEWIDEYLEAVGKKLVIFCYYRDVFDILCKHYKKISAIGGKSGKKRKFEEEKFQNNSGIRLFIGTEADKEAITLTSADTTFHIGIGFTPGGEAQKQGRIARITQKSSSITHYYMFGRNTIDYHIWNLIMKKEKIISQIIDDKDIDKKMMESISMRTLIRRLYKKEGGRKCQNSKK